MAMGQKRSARVMFGYIKDLDLYYDIGIYFETLFVGQFQTGHHSADIGKE